MPAVKTRALVISDRAYQDHDRLVTLFTEEEGKVQAIVKGARNPRSHLASASRLFAWSEFVYWPGKNLARIQEASLIDPFYAISEDFEKMSLASYPLELINALYDQNQPDAKMLKLLVYYLYYLSHEKGAQPELLTCAFQIKLLDRLGLRPNLEMPEANRFYFSIDEGGFTERKSEEGFSYCLRRDQGELLIDLFVTPIHKLKTRKEDPQSIKKLMKILNHFLQSQAERRFKSFQMYEEILKAR